ncbi:hypothetical protein B0H14DRAFT_2562512 [Mycena olivaceomarginata]|nr:hypothetical protein B0H14DRAFT_2562512 [Mycena olivaceomarginata]
MFMLKCNVPMFWLTTMLPLLALPPVLTRLICFHQRDRPSARILAPNLDTIVLSGFPIYWFAALLGLMSCTFHQTNVIWVLYAYASSQLVCLRFRRTPPGAKPLNQLHDPPALSMGLGDLVQSVLSVPKILGDIFLAFVPCALVLALFGAFVPSASDLKYQFVCSLIENNKVPDGAALQVIE